MISLLNLKLVKMFKKIFKISQKNSEHLTQTSKQKKKNAIQVYSVLFSYKNWKI